MIWWYIKSITQNNAVMTPQPKAIFKPFSNISSVMNLRVNFAIITSAIKPIEQAVPTKLKLSKPTMMVYNVKTIAKAP